MTEYTQKLYVNRGDVIHQMIGHICIDEQF